MKILIPNDIDWTIARRDLLNISNNVIGLLCEYQIMPSWSLFNPVISNRNLGVQQVGFMPVLPHLVSKYETVYTSLINFKNVLNQL